MSFNKLISVGGILIAIIGGAFVLGIYLGQAKFDSEKNELYFKSEALKDSLKYFVKKQSSTELHSITFNDRAQDLSLLRVVNYDKQKGLPFDIRTTFHNYTTARIDEVVNYCIYYHNTSKIEAKNVRLKLSIIPNGNFILACASITADNSSSILLGSCLLEIPNADSPKLRYISSKWYPNQSKFQSPFPANQEDQLIMSSDGIRIGDVAPNSNPMNFFDHQGAVNIAFQVE